MADAVVAKPAHPWRRVLRTIVAGLPALVVSVPVLINALNIDPDKYPDLYAAAVAVLAATAVFTRILALPGVEAFLQRFAKWLAASDVATEDVVSVVPDAIQGGDVIPGEVVAVAADASPLPNGTAVDVTPSVQIAPDTPEFD